GQRPVRASAAPARGTVYGRTGALPARRPAARRPCQGGARPRAVRDDPPIPRWERTRRSAADRVAAPSRWRAASAAPVPTSLYQAAPSRVLPPTRRRARRGGLGGLDRLLPRRR